VCRRRRIGEQTFYRWKAKYSGMSVSDAQKLEALDENRRLKKLLAQSMLDISALKDFLGKTDRAAARRAAVLRLVAERGRPSRSVTAAFARSGWSRPKLGNFPRIHQPSDLQTTTRAS